MSDNSRERRISEALHTLIDEFVAPYLTCLTTPQSSDEVLQLAFTKKEAAAALGCVPKTISRYIAAGKLTATGAGVKVLIAKSEIERFLHHNPRRSK